jgi:hypothetical protein
MYMRRLARFVAEEIEAVAVGAEDGRHLSAVLQQWLDARQ